MSKMTTADVACKVLSSLGLPKESIHQLLNQVSTWERSSGREWTVDRLKGLHNWYIQRKSGHEGFSPQWFRRAKDGGPLGIWRRVFEIKNPQKALAVLSLHTVYKEVKVTRNQVKKFMKGLLKQPPTERVDILFRSAKNRKILSERVNRLVTDRLKTLRPLPPSLASMTTNSWPGLGGKTYRPPKWATSDEARVLGLAESMLATPLCVLRYLRKKGALDIVPPDLLGEEEGFIDGLFLPGCEVVGRISYIQEPSLKSRVIANPNRVLQHYLRPLGRCLYDLLRSFDTDATFDQDEGVRWVKDQLSNGKPLFGADLTAATDTLPFLDVIQALETLSPDLSGNLEWQLFIEASRSPWLHRDDKGKEELVAWSCGQPLGTYPSFALLGIQHNLIALRAWEDACSAGHNLGLPRQCFRIVGDDIVMVDGMRPFYLDLMRRSEVEINLSKSLASSCWMEFCGREITSHTSYLKRIKFKEPTNNNFFEVVSQLGPQAKGLLTPEQRKVWDSLKYVPRDAVGSPWGNVSDGLSFEDRFGFWLVNEHLFTKVREEPESTPVDYTAEYMKMYYTMQKAGLGAEIGLSIPYSWIDEVQSSALYDILTSDLPKQARAVEFLSVLSKGVRSVEFVHMDEFLFTQLAKSRVHDPKTMAALVRLSKEPKLTALADKLGLEYLSLSAKEIVAAVSTQRSIPRTSPTKWNGLDR